MSIPELHYDDLNPQARSCVILIRLLNLNVELHANDSSKGGCMAQTAIEAPLFFHHDLTLRDSHSILVYLCEYCRNECSMQLYPNSYNERVNVMNKLYFEAKVLFQRYCEFMTDMLKKPVARINFDYHECQICNAYDRLDAFLCDCPFMAGDKFTIADVATMATVSSLDFMFPIESFDDSRWQNLYNWLNCMRNMPIYGLNYGGIEKQRYIMDSMLQVEPSCPRRSASAACVCCNYAGHLSDEPEQGHNCIFREDMPPRGWARSMDNDMPYKNYSFQRQQAGFSRSGSNSEFMPTFVDIPQMTRSKVPGNLPAAPPPPMSQHILRQSSGKRLSKRPTWNLRDKRRFPFGAKQEDEAIQSLRIHGNLLNTVMRSATDLRYRHFGSFQKGLPSGEMQEDYDDPTSSRKSRSRRSSKRTRQHSSTDDCELMNEEKMVEYTKRMGDFSLPESKRVALTGGGCGKSIPRFPDEDMFCHQERRCDNSEYHHNGFDNECYGNRKRESSARCEKSFPQVEEMSYPETDRTHRRKYDYEEARVQSGSDGTHRHRRLAAKECQQESVDVREYMMTHLKNIDMNESPIENPEIDVERCPSWQDEFVEPESDHTCNCMDPFKYTKTNDRPRVKYGIRKYDYFKRPSNSQEPLKQCDNHEYPYVPYVPDNFKEKYDPKFQYDHFAEEASIRRYPLHNFQEKYDPKFQYEYFVEGGGIQRYPLPNFKEKFDPKFQYQYFVEDSSIQRHPLLPFMEFEESPSKKSVAEQMYLLIKAHEPEEGPCIAPTPKVDATIESKEPKQEEGINSVVLNPPWIRTTSEIYHDNGYSGAKFLLRIDEKKKSANNDDDDDDDKDISQSKTLDSEKYTTDDEVEETLLRRRVAVVTICEKVDEAISCQTLDKFELYSKRKMAVEMAKSKEDPVGGVEAEISQLKVEPKNAEEQSKISEINDEYKNNEVREEQEDSADEIIVHEKDSENSNEKKPIEEVDMKSTEPDAMDLVSLHSFERKSTTMNLTTVAEKITKFENLSQRYGRYSDVRYSLKNRIKCYDIAMRHQKCGSHSQLVKANISKPILGSPMLEPNLISTKKRPLLQWTTTAKVPLADHKDTSHQHIGELGELVDLVLESKDSGKSKKCTDSKELKEIYVNKRVKCRHCDSDVLIEGIEDGSSKEEATLKPQTEVLN